MTDQPIPEPSPRLDELFTPAEEPVRVPDWMRQPQVEHEVTRAERLRLGWERHSAKLLAGVAALLVLGLFAVVGTVGYRFFEKVGDGPAAYPTITQPAGVQATSAASAPAAAGPFAGTPAEAFPDGAAGITLPPAKRTGNFTAKQASAGLRKVRAALVTARLDRAFMTSEDPEPLIRQFAPDARAGMREDFDSAVFASYATRLAPGARLTKHQPRVKGTVTYRATRDSDGIRVLEVTTNFAWAYAFQSTGAAPGDGVVVVHDTLLWHVPHPDDVESASVGLWLQDSDSYASNIDCAAFDKGLLDVGAPTYGGPVATEDPDAMFDPNRSLDIPDTC
ncbi:hypothetical protein EV384_2487 [Micromonospora kangleipakensis]|uniref:Uncharacterized protein n=1 Tax=Micromonospora kangleipakensis TaxID=1077942 RepID=A0A4Q8B8M6_9ACTN|nr:hypothetical protein [Micromonospora kangleipakensis]RZU74047.1 hypothetical protein EV384_2487 [Micromonospora kangleipakensis]